MITGGVVMSGSNCGVCGSCTVFFAGPKEWDELDTMLVERQRVPEMHDGTARAGEWQVFWN